MSSGLLAPPTVWPIEVGVAGLDRLAGESSDIKKPATHDHLTVKHLDEQTGGQDSQGGGDQLTCAVEPEGGGVEDGSPGGGVMSSGLLQGLSRVEGTSWRRNIYRAPLK